MEPRYTRHHDDRRAPYFSSIELEVLLQADGQYEHVSPQVKHGCSNKEERRRGKKLLLKSTRKFECNISPKILAEPVVMNISRNEIWFLFRCSSMGEKKPGSS